MRRAWIISLSLWLSTACASFGASKRWIPWSAAGYDADAQAFFNAVATNSGTISDATKGKVNTFVLAAKANGYWSDLTYVMLFCGSDLNAALTPLKHTVGNNPITNVNFVGGDYSEATGLTGNGSSKYLNTGIALNTLTLGNVSIGVVATGMPTSGTTARTLGGAQGPASAYEGIKLLAWTTNSSEGNFLSIDTHVTTGGEAKAYTTTGAVAAACLIGSQESTTSTILYRNGSSVASSANTTGTTPTTSNAIYVFALNNNGSPLNYHNSAIRAFFIGTALSATDVANINTDLEAFNDALSRGVQ